AVMTSETEPASEEFLANSRAGAGFEAVLANAAFGGFGGLFPPAELGRLAEGLVRRPKPGARGVAAPARRARPALRRPRVGGQSRPAAARPRIPGRLRRGHGDPRGRRPGLAHPGA